MASELTHELRALIAISQGVGSDPKLIQAGGGNTSVKNTGKGLMAIKASGTTMAGMDQSKGWVAVSLKKIEALLADEATIALPVQEREKKVVELLYGSVMFPEGVRPSVETPMHALLDTVVIHTHPVYANALTCNPDGTAIIEELNAKLNPEAPPLIVGYTDPGSVLAFTLAKEIEAYRGKNGVSPSIIFLENHGFVCCAPSAEGCLALHSQWMTAIDKRLGRSLAIDAVKQSGGSLTEAVRIAAENAAVKLGKEPPLVRYSTKPELACICTPERCGLFAQALTPDHVVYIGPEAVIVEESASREELDNGFDRFVGKYHAMPRLLLVKNRGMFLLGNRDAQIDAAEALCVSAVQIYLLAGGNLRFMTRPQVDFIMNWEAEHYRAKQIK